MPGSAGCLAPDFVDTPYWWQAAPPDPSCPETLPSKADVVVVGSGFAGMCCALELAENGATTVVLDAGDLGSGASSRSGAMVTGGQKLVVTEAIQGLDPARQADMLRDAKESLSMLEERVVKYQLDTDYHRYGRIIVAQVPKHMERLRRWAELLRSRAGSTVSVMDRDALTAELGSRRYHGGILIEDYGGIHPAKYHRALRETARRFGAVLCARTPAQHVAGTEGDFLVTTPRGTIQARHVVVTTNGYTGGLVPFLQRRVVPVGAYAIATETLPDGVADTLIPQRRMCSDTQRDLYWFRMSPDGTRLIFGARPFVHETTPAKAAPALHRMMTGVFPQLADARVAFCWRGNVAMSADHVPHMGTHAGIHYALACNGSGVAMMSYLGYRTARKILGLQNQPCAFDQDAFPAIPLYDGRPWFVPLVSAWYRAQDWAERVAARL